MNRLLILAACLGTAVAADVASTSRVFRVHEVDFADPDTIAEIARAALSDGSRLVVDAPRRRLLLYATEAEHAQVAELTRSAAAPPPMVRIEVRRRTVGRSRELAAATEVGGTVDIGGGRVSGELTLHPQLGGRFSETAEDLVQTVSVLSGRSASLHIGEEVPYLDWLQQCAIGWGITTVAVRWRAVGASLVVEPTVIGQGSNRRVLIRLVPELSGVSERGPLRWRFQRVATELVAAPGETVRFGGSSTHADFYDRFLVGIRRGGRHDKIELELTPTVTDALPAAGPERLEGAVGR